MKTFTQKLGRSLWAMTCGWIACNIVLLGTTLGQVHGTWREAPLVVAVYAFYSGVVILAACLVVFLPVDLLLPDQSVWREPGPAALLGFVAGTCVPLLLILGYSGSPRSWSLMDLLNNFEWSALPWLLSPGVTGMVAGLVGSRYRETARPPHTP